MSECQSTQFPPQLSDNSNKKSANFLQGMIILQFFKLSPDLNYYYNCQHQLYFILYEGAKQILFLWVFIKTL